MREERERETVGQAFEKKTELLTEMEQKMMKSLRTMLL